MVDLTDQDEYTYEAIQNYVWRIEMIYRDLLAKEIANGLEDSEKEALEYIAQAHYSINNCADSALSQNDFHTPAQAQLLYTGAVGRPSFDIPHSQLQNLIEWRFSVPQIAQLMGVSHSTIRRSMSRYSLSIRATYSSISDEELDHLVATAQQQFPNWGNRQMFGRLISQGIRVPFLRVQQSQRRVDPEGSMMRRLQRIGRRCYSVLGPQHLWHVDGHHKLIRFDYMIQALI